MNESTEHFALGYARKVNEHLHQAMSATTSFRHEIFEVPNLVTGHFVTYDGIDSDEFIVHSPVDWPRFRTRLMQAHQAWHDLTEETVRKFRDKPEKSMTGCENRTIYSFRGGSNPNYWTEKYALEFCQVTTIGVVLWGPMLKQEWQNITTTVLVGKDGGADGAKAYERMVRIVIRFLFSPALSDGIAHSRTEDDGVEVRDLICHNASTTGFWKDLKDKYQCTEVIFEVKNKDTVTRDDLRQAYCYLKPALGLWGFLVTRARQGDSVAAYNRMLFKNFAQERGVLIICEDDIRKMIDIKLRGQDPGEYLAKLKSDFARSV